MTGPKATRKRDPRARHSQRAQAMAQQAQAIKARHAAQAAAERQAQAERADAEYQSQLLTTRLKVWATAEGDDATDLIAALFVVIGTPCEAGARVHGRESVWVRQLHGALRSLSDLCLHNGYRWRTACAPAIDRAIDLAEEHGRDLWICQEFRDALIEANGAAAMVLAHQIEPGTIAGAT